MNLQSDDPCDYGPNGYTPKGSQECVGKQVPRNDEQTEECDEGDTTERSPDMGQPRDEVLLVQVHETVLLNLRSVRTKLVEGGKIAKSIRVAVRQSTRKVE